MESLLIHLVLQIVGHYVSDALSFKGKIMDQRISKCGSEVSPVRDSDVTNLQQAIRLFESD